jgi:hypothetical protein
MDARCGLKFPAIGIEERLHLARESAAGLLAIGCDAVPWQTAGKNRT